MNVTFIHRWACPVNIFLLLLYVARIMNEDYIKNFPIIDNIDLDTSLVQFVRKIKLEESDSEVEDSSSELEGNSFDEDEDEDSRVLFSF